VLPQLLGILFVKLGVCRGADDLIDTLVVKPDRNSAWREENGHTIARNDRVGVINLKSFTTVKFHGENAKRPSMPEARQKVLKVVSRHNEARKRKLPMISPSIGILQRTQ